MKPSSREYSRANDLGAQARRAGKKIDANPWRLASNEHDQLLRDSWADGFGQVDAERSR
jgi:hypothetical protein